MRRAADRRGARPVHRSAHPEFVELVAQDPLLSIERGQQLFAEGDVPTCMYIVKTGQLQISSGGVVYEDVGPGGIFGEMGVIETQELRSATVHALSDSELVEINDARFAELIARAPGFAIAVMRYSAELCERMRRSFPLSSTQSDSRSPSVVLESVARKSPCATSRPSSGWQISPQPVSARSGSASRTRQR